MSSSVSFQALRRANPRGKPGFAQAVDAAADAVRAQFVTAVVEHVPARPRRLARVSVAGVSVAAAAAAAAALTLGSIGGGTGVENAVAAVKNAATVTAASAERSGTAVVRMTHNGDVWAGATVRWNGDDVAIGRHLPARYPRSGGELLVVDEVLYGEDPEVEGGWIKLGSPANIDPDSGTTPDEYLAAVREDVGGVTLRRFTRGMNELTATPLADGSTLYLGTVAAGLIARETGFKEGQHIRVLPFGYVAHDEAADPASPLDTAVTVGPDDIVREISVTWGTRASAWTYTVTYSDLGATPAPAAPANAPDIVEDRLRAVGR
jgi:hypothetical protein